MNDFAKLSKSFILAAALSVPLSLTAAAVQAAGGEPSKPAATTTVGKYKKAYSPEECDALIEEAIKNRDLEAAVSLYEHNGTFITGSGEAVSGHDAVREQMRPLMDAEYFAFTAKPKSFLSADKDIALLRGTWTAKIKDAKGNITTIGGNNVEVVRRQPDGSWLFVIDHPTLAD